MKIEEFWTKAFLAALSRVPPPEAKKEADEATSIAVSHWQEQIYNWGQTITPRWQEQSIYDVPKV